MGKLYTYINKTIVTICTTVTPKVKCLFIVSHLHVENSSFMHLIE